ncbi:hypothetical protein [Ancylobacter oerskovii]|uniref:Uncharacterized protein n=1 Tax=Ancylobacter oerskovii TaxID=459519 RepID=A0ABW4Z5R5_9HYPH|nr:hypothetical protein [Ancylobacter oerskovii]MBS7545557.1 hypothetical protein [Ancylobacter oerskovii]
MTIDVNHYAQKIIDARARIKAARDPQDALDALEAFKVLADDPDMLAILAGAYLLVSAVAFDAPPD